MRTLVAIVTLCGLVSAATPAGAQDPEAPIVVQAPARPTTPPTTPPPSQPTLMDYARPRPPFSLAARTGAGQLLFDIGLAADFIGSFNQENIDAANAGTFAGRENRFFPREIELSLFGQIDPYARGEVRIEAAEEFEDDALDLHVGLAEAHLTLLTLPFGTQLKLGKMRNRFGLLNEHHQHDLPQPDRPNVLVRFFGEEQLVESGAEFSWVPPLPFYLELLGGVFNGDNEDAFGRGSIRSPLATGRVRTFFELGGLGAIQLGASIASGETVERRREEIVGVDAKYKWQPDGWRWAPLTVAGEGLWSLDRTTSIDTDGDGVADATEEHSRDGWYVYAEVRPWQRWLGGVRYDNTQFLDRSGREWAVEPYVAFQPSDFLRFRLAYKHTERDQSGIFSTVEGSAHTADEIFLQATFILGAHPAHPF